MGSKSTIEWVAGDDGAPGATWNPVRGCSIVSPGCKNCYALQMAARFSDPGYWGHGFAERTPHGPRWTRKLSLLPHDTLELPTRWREPKRVFVNSTSDLFHEGLTFEQIAAVYGVMAQTPWHTYVVLTKRAARMRQWFEWVASDQEEHGPPPDEIVTTCAVNFGAEIDQLQRPWPLPNVVLGVSVESQEYADERIPHLLATPAAVRGVSYEPALGLVRFREEWLHGAFDRCPDETADPETDECQGCPGIPGDGDYCGAIRGPRLDWVIVGGESGHGARPFDIAWARSVVRQCREAKVACFVKQLGARPYESVSDASRGAGGIGLALRDKKGGNPAEWPEDLRVRQFPEVRRAA